MDMENEGDKSLFRIPLDRVGGLTDEQERVLKEVMKGFDILVTGGAGTGKTATVAVEVCKKTEE